MDRERFSLIGHGDLPFFSPVSEARMDAVIDSLDLRPGDSVLDVGCGRAELLLRIIERTGARGVGVDSGARSIAQAREGAARRVPPGAVEFHERPFDADDFEAASSDAVLCIGSTHAVAPFGDALRGLQGLARPGGRVVCGHGFWSREPDPEYLRFLGGEGPDPLVPEARNREVIAAAGLETLHAWISTQEEWDTYEDTYSANIERYVADHPDDPDSEAMLARIRPWREAYLKWGRGTMGFAVYVLRRPAEDSP